MLITVSLLFYFFMVKLLDTSALKITLNFNDILVFDIQIALNNILWQTSRLPLFNSQHSVHQEQHRSRSIRVWILHLTTHAWLRLRCTIVYRLKASIFQNWRIHSFLLIFCLSSIAENTFTWLNYMINTANVL